MKLRLAGPAASTVEIRVNSFSEALKSILRSLPSSQIVIAGTSATTDPQALDGYDPIAGAGEIWVGTTTLDSVHATDILTEAGAIASTAATAFDTISKVGSRWTVESTQITPTNLAAVLSGDSTRTTLAGITEIVGYLLVSAGQSEISLPYALVVDQPGQRMGLLDSPNNLTSGTTIITWRAAIKEINTDVQDFLETY